MDVFRNAESVRLISYRDKYLVAGNDLEEVTTQEQDEEGSRERSIWQVELVDGSDDVVRLRSRHGTYLTASSSPFLPGVTAKKVHQTTTPYYSDPATQWTPLRDGMQVKLRSFWGNYLRPNGGLPPWRNSITHDIYHRPKSREKLLWDVEVVQRRSPDQRRLCRLRSRSFSAFITPPHKQIFIRSQEFI